MGFAPPEGLCGVGYRERRGGCGHCGGEWGGQDSTRDEAKQQLADNLSKRYIFINKPLIYSICPAPHHDLTVKGLKCYNAVPMYNSNIQPEYPLKLLASNGQPRNSAIKGTAKTPVLATPLR